MPRFYFVLSARGVLIDRHGCDPVIGFIAMREGKGADIGAAEKLVKIELLKEWKQTFNQNNKAGTPVLEVIHCSRIRNPLKKVRPRDDFQFFSEDAKRDELLEQACKAARSWLNIS